jgi:hypothetical protein
MARAAAGHVQFLRGHPVRMGRLLFGVLGWLLLEATPAVFPAAPSLAWKNAWEETVDAAKKEGQISVYGSDTFELFF